MPPMWTDGKAEQAQPDAAPRLAEHGRDAAKVWFYRMMGERPRLWASFGQQVERLWRLPRQVRRQISRKVTFGLAGMALLLALSSAPVAAAAITVANGEVAINDNNLCSLREAIINANADSQVHNDCAGGGVNDFVALPENGAFVINNSYVNYNGPTGLPVISGDVQINGNGSTISRPNSAPNFRFLAVGDGGNLHLSGVTLQRGHVANQNGGAILVDQGSLIVSHTTITDSRATGTGNGGSIANRNGTVFVTNDSAIVANVAGAAGGGIFSTIDASGSVGSGYITVNLSTISGNTAAVGGGIAVTEEPGAPYSRENSTVLWVYWATISDNAAGDGGGLSIERDHATAMIEGATLNGNSATGDGGGIYAGFPDTIIVKITNSTISSNAAGGSGGGVNNQEAQVIMANATVTGNGAGQEGGGLWQYGGGTIAVERSIVSGNTAPTGPEGFAGTEGIGFSNGFNIFGHSDNAGLYYYDNASDPLDPTDLVPTQPLAQIITQLQNLGGWPVTETHGLPAYSPAIDRAPSADCLGSPVQGHDQREKSRNEDGQLFNPSDHECDVGAFEKHLANIQVSTNALPVVLNYIVDSPYELLDGRREGLPAAARFDAIDVPDGETAHLSFLKPTPVPGLGRVPAQDIVTFNDNTFALAFDGSDVGLTTTGENIDAVSFLEGEVSPIGQPCRAYLLISTKAAGSVPGPNGQALRFRGEDLLGFCATELGATTRGQWHLAFDGSAEGLPLNTLTNLAALDNGRAFFFMTSGSFRADGVTGRSRMIYRFDADTELITGPYWAAAESGLTETVIGLGVTGDLLLEDRS